jgi:nuclear pore complex protein Nup98-Nup96
LQEGDCWVRPDLETLKCASFERLLSFIGLIVGRVGYGEIHFLEVVDLTGLTKLSVVLGEIVRFEEKECSAYSDYDEVDEPSPQSGLNVQAKVMLVRCWTQDKATLAIVGYRVGSWIEIR